jgi:Family of unknown function (DUF6599)
MKNILLSASLLMALSLSALAQEITMPDLKGYKKDISAPVYLPENLGDYINGTADTYLSYGFADLNIAGYKKGKNVIKLEVYRQSDNTMAFGIYSIERSPAFHYLNLGSQGYSAEGAINFFKGNYYVKIKTSSKKESTLKSAETLAHEVADMLPGNQSMPSQLSLFPSEGKKVNEETYINESVLGHKFLNQAFKVTYQTGNDIFSIFIIDNKSPDEALKTLNEYLEATGTESGDSDTGRYMFKDGYNGTIFLSVKDNRLVIISGLSKDQSEIADKYTSEILK